MRILLIHHPDDDGYDHYGCITCSTVAPFSSSSRRESLWFGKENCLICMCMREDLSLSVCLLCDGCFELCLPFSSPREREISVARSQEMKEILKQNRYVDGEGDG